MLSGLGTGVAVTVHMHVVRKEHFQSADVCDSYCDLAFLRTDHILRPDL
jgi:hypothetical protein